MNFKFVKIKDNGDATSNYDIVGDFPVLIGDFVTAMTDETKDFRVKFYITNEQMGGWTRNSFELNKRNGEWYINEEKPAFLIDVIRHRKVVSCHANGGYGQMSYFCELEDDDCMIFYGDRIKIKNAYYEWLMENPGVKDCAENLIEFMAIEGLLKDRNECDFYERQTIKLFKKEYQERE